jgi:hypothetical protein
MSTAVQPAADITTTALPVNVPQTGAVMTPMAMIDRALASGATPETLEKLLALQERWEAGQAKKAFDAAIGAAKAQIPPIIKNKGTDFESKRTGTTTSYKYETLPALARVLEPILHAHGLSYRYTSKVEAGQIAVTCVISHIDGHKEETTLQCGPDTTGNKNAVQAIGSATTYLQRYTLKLALGISAADDDDANKVSDMDTISAEQFQELSALIDKAEADERKIIDYVAGNDLETLSVAQYKMAKSALNDFMRNRGRRK